MLRNKTDKSIIPLDDSGSSRNQQFVTMPNQNRPFLQHPSKTNSETTSLNESIFSSNQQQMTVTMSFRRKKQPMFNKESLKSFFERYVETTLLNGSSSNQKQSLNQESLRISSEHNREVIPLNEFVFSSNQKLNLSQESLGRFSEQNDERTPLNGSIFPSNQQQVTVTMVVRKRNNSSFNQESLERFLEWYAELNGYFFSSNHKLSLNQESLGRFSEQNGEMIPLNRYIFSNKQKPSRNENSLGKFSEPNSEITPLSGSISSSNQQQVTMLCSERKKSNLNKIFLNLFFNLSRETISLNESRLFTFLSFYENCKSFINPHVSREIILFELPKLCFRRQLENSTAITKVLLSIHGLPGTALPHIVFFLSFNTVCNYILPRKSTDGGKKERTRYVSFLAFFLEHCNAEKFTIDGKRVTEMIEATNPVLYARLLVFSDTNCVLALLQHGLRFCESNYESKVHPIFLYILALLCKFAPGVVHRDVHGPRSDPRKFTSLLANFKIILRSTCNPRAVIFHMATVAEREFHMLVDPISSFLKFANQGEDIRLQSPPTLKHVCRHVIRQRLYENWNLPHGIRQLPMKPCLISYLQLCAD